MSRLITLLISSLVLCTLCLPGTAAAGGSAEVPSPLRNVAPSANPQSDQAERWCVAGVRHKEQREFAKSAWLIKQAAEQGHLMAQYVLGSFFKDGVGVAQDEIEAYAWWGLPADAGCQQAKAALAAVQPELDRDRGKMAAVYRRIMELGSCIHRR